METNGSGGFINERMDRVEAILNQVAADQVFFLEEHRKFQQEHQLLLRAQVAMQDTMRELAIAQKSTDERLNALISVVDGWIRSNPK